MYANYHTHTKRCHHAIGEEREYVEAAIKAGYSVLGFADHVTHIVKDRPYDYRSRMRPEETAEYIMNLQRLRDEYVNDIKIHIGFEMEYYPSYFEDTLDFLANFDSWIKKLIGFTNITAANANENKGNKSTNCFDKCRFLYLLYDDSPP